MMPINPSNLVDITQSINDMFDDDIVYDRQYPIGENPNPKYNIPSKELDGKTLNEYDKETYLAFTSYNKPEKL